MSQTLEQTKENTIVYKQLKTMKDRVRTKTNVIYNLCRILHFKIFYQSFSLEIVLGMKKTPTICWPLFNIHLKDKKESNFQAIQLIIFHSCLKIKFICTLHSYMINFFNFSMTQPEQKQILDVLVANEATTRKFSQNFQYKQYRIQHQHRIQVELTQQRTQQLVIFNHFAVIIDNKLVKVTEIRLDNRIIKLIDSFQTKKTSNVNIPLPESQNIKEPIKQSNRKQILSKKYLSNLHNQNPDNDNKLRDTKNLVKNTIRLFQTWLEERMEISGEVYRSLTEMMKNTKFNNSFIVTISKNPPLRKAFLYFCQTDAEQFIKKSKINDKTSHLEALEKYQNLCVDEEDMDQQKDVSKRKDKSKQLKEGQKVEMIMQEE